MGRMVIHGCPCIELAGEFVGQNVMVRSVGNVVVNGVLQPIGPDDRVITLARPQGPINICCDNIFSVSSM